MADFIVTGITSERTRKAMYLLMTPGMKSTIRMRKMAQQLKELKDKS